MGSIVTKSLFLLFFSLKSSLRNKEEKQDLKYIIAKQNDFSSHSEKSTSPFFVRGVNKTVPLNDTNY